MHTAKLPSEKADRFRCAPQPAVRAVFCGFLGGRSGVLNLSIASAVGFIALGGVAAEIGVVMLVYLNQAIDARAAAKRLNDEADLVHAVIHGAALRMRPIAMTVAVIIVGLLPIVWGTGTGSEVVRRIAAPMVGGMITAPLLSMLMVPVVYMLVRRRSLGA